MLREGDTLAVWQLSRLGRSLKHLIDTVQELEQHGVGFKSLNESLDTTTNGGKLVFHIFGALAEFERSIIQDRTRAGLAASRARGRMGGRPPLLDEKDKAAGLALLRDPSIPVKEVARRLGISVAALYHHFPGGRGAVLESTTTKT